MKGNCPNLRQVLLNLHEDVDRYVVVNSERHWLATALLSSGVWISFQYRLSRWVHFRVHVPILRQALKIFFLLLQKHIEHTTGSEISNRTKIGRGLFIPHVNGIVIHMDARIGDYCSLGQQVTIGIAGRGDNRGVPIIGDRVFIGPGAKLFGPIRIGNNVAIGANAVVTKDVPDNAVVVGVPGKVISFDGSREFVIVRVKANEPHLET